MSQWIAVHGIQDDTNVDAETINRPLFELTERTSFLYNRLDELTGASLFESVRLFAVPLTTEGSLAPAVKDMVTLDRVSGTYVKAVASMSTTDEFRMASSAFAVGMLIAKSGSTGTVICGGRISMNTGGTSWALADLLESGEVFRDGDYYLSATEPGRITANPSGPVIYIGLFKSGTDSAYGDYAVITPQFHDLGTGHVHRSYRLHAKPAARQYVTDTGPGGVHYLIGFPPVATLDEGDNVPRLVCYGNWTGPSSVQYRIWLSNVDGTTQATSAAPTSFSDAYVHWTSSDPGEPQGKARVWSYEIPVSVGSYGLKVVLENATGLTPGLAQDWDIVYDAVSDAPDKRTWTVTVPDHITGWLPCRYRQYLTDTVSVDGRFSMILLGGPRVSDGSEADTINVFCGEMHQFDVTAEPVAGDTLDLPAAVFEFTADGTVTDPDNIPVLLTGDAAASFQNLLTALIAHPQDGIVPVLGDEVMILATPAATSVSFAGADVPAIADGDGTITEGSSPSVALAVYDQHNRNLIDVGSWSDSYFWHAAQLWTPIELSNGLMLMLVPFDSDGTPLSSAVVNIGDLWTADIVDRAPGAAYAYSMGMHPSLSAYYPPVPAKTAALVLNGVELDSGTFFDNPTYGLELDTIYWYPDGFAQVPWPADWVAVNDEGSDNYVQKLILHFVRNTSGATGHVTSLRPAPGSPIKVTSTGDDDYVGDLTIDVDLAVETEDADLTGYNVVKAAVGNKLRRGPVVERIVAGAGLVLTQSAGAPNGQGVVTLGLASANAVYTGEFEEIALQNAKQSMIGLFPYVRLLGWAAGSANTPSAFTAKFRVPHSAQDGYYRVVVYATVFGEASVPAGAGVAPTAGLDFTYSILPDVYAIGDRPVTSSLNLAENLIGPTAANRVSVSFGDPDANPIYTAYDPVLVHNAPLWLEAGSATPNQKQQALGSPFPNTDDIPLWNSGTLGVRPGSLVAVKFARADSLTPDYEYTGALGFINLRWMLVSVAS